MNLLQKIKWRLKRYNFAYLANALGYSLVPKGSGYIRVADVVPKAAAASKSLCDYLEDENIGGVGRRRDFIIQELNSRKVFENKTHILEIGAGTGMYLEKTLSLAQPKTYEVYETALDWVTYLQEQYKGSEARVVCHNANGRNLHQTADASVDLLLAHAVYVYIPMIASMKYLIDSARVLKPGGLMVFDVFSDQHFHWDVVKQWIDDSSGYVFPVVIAHDLVQEFAKNNGFNVLHMFDSPLHASTSTYYILEKK